MEELKLFIEEIIVVDTDSHWVYIGKLKNVGSGFILLEDADAHNLEDTISTREEYVRSVKINGVVVNRKKVWIKENRITSISLLEDVIP